MLIKKRIIVLIVICATLAFCQTCFSEDLELTTEQTDETFTVTISMNGAPNNVKAFGFDVWYCEDSLEYQKYEKGGLTQQFDAGGDDYMFESNRIGQHIRVGGYNASRPIASGTSGAIVKLFFNITAHTAECDISLHNLTDDISQWSYQNYRFIHTPSNLTWYKDSDGDKYSEGTRQSSGTQPAGYYLSSDLIATSGDCDDNNASVNPAAAENCDNDIDDNCDGIIAVCPSIDAEDKVAGKAIPSTGNYTIVNSGMTTNDVTVRFSGTLYRDKNRNGKIDSGTDEDLGAITDPAKIKLSPGPYLVEWTAQNPNGDTASEIQQINVIPQVMFNRKKQVAHLTGTPQTISIGIKTNGEAAAYPVTVPYTVASDPNNPAINPDDHNAPAGNIQIGEDSSSDSISFDFNATGSLNSGKKRGVVIFNINADSLSNAVTGGTASHEVVLIDINKENLPPKVLIKLKKTGESSYSDISKITVAQGINIDVKLETSDPNGGDTVAVEWNCSRHIDNCPVDGAAEWTIGTSSLPEGLYTIEAKATDDNSANSNKGPLTQNNVCLLKVVASGTALVDDSTGNGIFDDQYDSDGDGIFDDQDDDIDGDGILNNVDNVNDVANILRAPKNAKKQQTLSAESGLTLSLGKYAFKAGKGALIDLTDIDDGGGTDIGEYDDIIDVLDFEIDGLAETGEKAKLVLPLSKATGTNTVYRKFSDQTGWATFVSDADNKIYTAVTEDPEGICPDAGNSLYTEVDNATGVMPSGMYCLQLEIKDGGPYDTDGAENGKIADPGAVANNSNVISGGGGGGGGGGGCSLNRNVNFSPTLLLMFLISIIYITKHALLKMKK
ncbi:exported hypothetical protein [Candidatus Desulfarcum epimagneticum]|uniref:Cohesin domain-containing protein n=1 Tax=uncultured Desulfobacteraceae bacterium TaxID=218296 RepID=A0A484HIW6_9BACT|nr:exported hypothetical protein [uncultured Desulfobacteraceae bacterium]